MIELVVLDIAGTTVEEHNAVYEALAGAVRGYGASPTPADIGIWMGADKREAIRGLIQLSGLTVPADPVVEEIHDRFRSLLAQAYRDDPPTPLPGVPEALGLLRAKGVKIALTTGFDHEVAGALLAMIGWSEGVIDALICVDDVRAGRPAPYMIFQAMERTGVVRVGNILVAGDTTRDLEAGANAGAGLVVGVGTGAMGLDALGQAPHTHLLPSVADLPDLLATSGLLAS
ncbi:MAG: phosphonatase-like hydrolase [Bifidobacteriaceae bacterium]|jgi:phosphonatase-like hydrolase|nr:phosphonatase-like hydrolase [Bifidobacteriaceae bacterium]